MFEPTKTNLVYANVKDALYNLSAWRCQSISNIHHLASSYIYALPLCLWGELNRATLHSLLHSKLKLKLKKLKGAARSLHVGLAKGCLQRFFGILSTSTFPTTLRMYSRRWPYCQLTSVGFSL